MPAPGQPALVCPGLWVSGVAGIETALQAHHITHLISVVNGPPPEVLEPSGADLAAPLQRLHIDIEDLEDADLLKHLPAAVNFITTSLQPKTATPAAAGGVLVHCAQGTSRSAAVVVAYLMATRDLDPDAALEVLKRAVPAAAPNPGFLHQLHLFHCMGCSLDPRYIPYKRFASQQAALRYHESGVVDLQSLNSPEEFAPASSTGGSSQQQKGRVRYRCRKCRLLLATSDNVLEAEGEQAGSFAWRKRDKAPQQGGGAVFAPHTSNIFVEPLRWMAGVVSEVQGKLYCPNGRCTARLGAFNWAGIQNSAGGWVTPGFQLHAARLDAEPQEATPLQVQLAGLAIRQPKLFAPKAAAPAAAETISTPLAAPVAPSTAPAAFTHLILDCDGVLVDSERPSCEALRQAILKVTGYDIPHDFPIDYHPVFGMDVRSCVHYYADRFAAEHDWGSDLDGLAKQVSAAKEGLYKELTAQGVKAFPGVEALVQAARKRGMGVAVASSGSPEKIAHNLGTSGLAHLFGDERLVVSAAYVKRGKPAPDVYLEALRRLGCADARRSLVIEDAVNGLNSAKEAGCFAVGVASSLPAEALVPHADAVVERLKDVDLAALELLLLK